MSTDRLERAAAHIREALEGSPWYGPSLAAVLRGIDARRAAARPIPDAHSIWEITLHLTTWLTVPRLRLEGLVAEPSPKEDWPAVVDTSEAAWAGAQERLRQSARALLAALDATDAAHLTAPVPGKPYRIDFMLRGVAEHVAYHAGQIVLLDRATGPSEPTR